MSSSSIDHPAAGHRADFERERERADALMAELFEDDGGRHGGQGGGGSARRASWRPCGRAPCVTPRASSAAGMSICSMSCCVFKRKPTRQRAAGRRMNGGCDRQITPIG